MRFKNAVNEKKILWLYVYFNLAILKISSAYCCAVLNCTNQIGVT